MTLISRYLEKKSSLKERLPLFKIVCSDVASTEASLELQLYYPISFLLLPFKAY